MKKNIKLVLALVLSVMMILGSVAFADAPTSGTITITTSADGTVTGGRTFNAYKIFDATEIFANGDNQPATGYSYTFPTTGIRDAVAALDLINLTQNSGESDIAYAQRIFEKIGTLTVAADIEKFAKELLKIAKDANIAPTELTMGTASAALPFGYYVIEDVTDPEQPNVSAVMLDTTNPNLVINIKASKPTLEKKIDEGSTAGRYDESDLVYDNHRIGDTVPYVIKSNIPEMTGFTKYYYIVNDTLSKGLKFDNNIVIRAYGNAAAGAEDDTTTTYVNESVNSVRTLTAGTDYTVTFTPNPSTGEDATTIKIVFNDFYNKEKDHAGEILEITYSATVTKDAIIGVEGNPNTATLIYSNNPNDDYSNEPTGDEPQDTSLTSTTPGSTTRTYVTGLKVVKVDPAGNRLSGATFELSGALNKVEVLTGDKFVEADDGTYYLLKDGSYTTQNPTELNPAATNYDELLAKYVDKTGATKYKKTTYTYVEKTAAGNPLKVSETTTADGIIIFDGMAEGTFTLEETAAPTGYNKLKYPIGFSVTCTPPTATDGTGNCTWTVTMDPNNKTNDTVVWDEIAQEFRICIQNNTGAELPSTGGIGTTIFYVAGSILVLAAAILLITKRRMSNND